MRACAISAAASRLAARLLVTDRSPVSVALIRQMMYRNSAAASPLEAHLVESLSMFYTSIGNAAVLPVAGGSPLIS